jgi:hypothetical protein
MRRAGFGSVLLAVFLLAAATSVRAAAPDLDWAEIYGDSLRDVGYWIEEHSYHGYVVSGYADFGNTGTSKALLMRLNSVGDTLWARTYRDTLPGAALCVQETPDRGYILAGYVEMPTGNADALFIRTDANGDTLWTRSFDFGEHEYLYRVLETPDGGFIAAGFTSSLAPAGSTDVLVIKIDEDGHGEWKKLCGGPGHNRAYDICRASDGDYVVSGYSEVGADLGDVLIMKVDADNGDSLWAKTYGDTTRETGRSIEMTHDGGFIVAGSRSDYTPGRISGYLLRTDATGDSLWAKVYGDTSVYTSFTALALTPDHGFICAGYIDTTSTGNSDCYYVKTNSNGDVQWTKAVGKDAREAALCVAVTSDLGYASAGYSRELPGGDYYVFVVKLGEDEAGVDPVGEQPLPGLLAVDGANPFTSSVPVRYEIPATSHVSLAVYDVEGRQVAVLTDAVRSAGVHSAVWDLRNAGGSLVPSGVYFIRCAAAGRSGVEKVIVLR